MLYVHAATGCIVNWRGCMHKNILRYACILIKISYGAALAWLLALCVVLYIYIFYMLIEYFSAGIHIFMGILQHEFQCGNSVL